MRHSLRFRTMISCCFSKSAFITVTLSNFCAKGGCGLMVICQDFLFHCYYLKDMKYPFESKCEIISAVPFRASHDAWPSSRWRLTREPRLILLSPHLHPACACTPAKSSPLSLGSLAASPLALPAHRVLSPSWGGWTEGRTRHHSKRCKILGERLRPTYRLWGAGWSGPNSFPVGPQKHHEENMKDDQIADC